MEIDNSQTPVDLTPDKQPEPLKADTLSIDQVQKWFSRAKTASKFHRRELIPKYKQAKRRYNSEIGYAGINYSSNATRAKANHTDINLLFKDVRDFIASIFYRNPEVDLSAQSEDPEEVFNIENLEQALNDDIENNGTEIKAILRSTLVDECLSSMGAVYIDYDYRDVPSDEVYAQDDMGQVMKPDVVSNKVIITKIRPENLIRPPGIYYYNYKHAQYLGYIDIVPVETLKNDASLDPAVVARVKGKEYRALLDIDIKELDKTNLEDKDDILHAKIYTIFIKGSDNSPLKRLVLCDDDEVKDTPLSYGDWDKGHGKDDRGYPIHLLQLNEGSDSFIPPSEAWVLEPILQVIDHVFAKMNRHLKKSSTRTFVKTGTGGVEKTELDKMVRNNDLEYISVDKLPPGVTVDSILKQIVDQPLSADHTAMFELAKRIFDNLSRQPSFSQPSLLNQKKTATETQAIQQTDSTENGDYIDKYKDFLCDLFYDWAKLLQRNMQGVRDLTIEDPRTGEKIPRPDITSEQMQGKFKASINVTSFLPPNKEMKRRIVKETIQDLVLFQPFLQKSGQQINAKKAVDMLLENIEVRDPANMIVPVPVRTIDQQVTDAVFHGAPMNPQDLGDDNEKALLRLQQIFQDDAQMGTYEQLKPGIGGPKGEIVQFMMMLEQMIQGKQGGGAPKAPPSSASSDMRANAGMMAGAQRP